MLARTLHTLRHSKLMCLTIGLFLAAYIFVGYFLFQKGLSFVSTVPGVGLLLMERIVHMVFFFFFLMLVFSNSVLLYSAVFRGKETAWLLTLPVSPRAVFCWKVVESFLMSSWGLAVLSAPLLLSVGQTFGAPPEFYVKCAAVYLPFMVLPATLAGMVVMLLVRWWGRAARVALWLTVAFFLWKAADSWISAREVSRMAATADMSRAMGELLGHSEIMLNRLLPSAWMGEMVILWARGHQAHGLFYGLLLLSQALMMGWLCVYVVSRLCYTSWNLSQRRKAEKTGARFANGGRPDALEFRGALRAVGRLPFVSRRGAAMMVKDVREFIRDPAQWVPCAVVFGLLFLYAGNLNRAAASDVRQPVFRLVLTYLNFGVCALTLSTLTTRFIFPLFSLEGRRLWILGLSPIPMTRVFRQKLLLFAGVIGILTCLLMLLSGLRLGMALPELSVYCIGIVLMSFGLTSLSLGLGVIFPNFDDPSPAKIVSGFGGTLCLILNFIYIVLFMGVFVLPAALRHWYPQESFTNTYRLSQALSVGGMIVITAVCGGIPLFLSIRRMKRLELLGKL